MSVSSTAFLSCRNNTPRNLEQEYSKLFQVNKTYILSKGLFLLVSKMCGSFADTKLSAMLQSELLQNMQPSSSGSDTGSTDLG